MSTQRASEKFTKSRWWRNYDTFTASDVATFCGISVETVSTGVLQRLRGQYTKYERSQTETTKTGEPRVYYQRNRPGGTLLSKPWPNSLTEAQRRHFSPRWF